MLLIPSTTQYRRNDLFDLFHGTEQDFDMAEYEVLGLDQWDPKQLQLKTESTALPPSLTPPSSTTATPTPPALEQPEEAGRKPQVASSSPQLRLTKRKAPEVYRLVSMAGQHGCSAAA